MEKSEHDLYPYRCRHPFDPFVWLYFFATSDQAAEKEVGEYAWRTVQGFNGNEWHPVEPE